MGLCLYINIFFCLFIKQSRLNWQFFPFFNGRYYLKSDLQNVRFYNVSDFRMVRFRIPTVFFLHAFLIYFLISTVGQATKETSVRFPPKESCLDQGLTRFSKQRVKQGNWKWQLLLRHPARISLVDSVPFRTHCPSISSTMLQLHQTR